MKTVLTIAGSDCSGGAGIQADIKTMTVNGVYAMSVITALTAQNTLGVQGISKTEPEFLAMQLDSVFNDIIPDAVKIGMITSKAQIDVIYDKLTTFNAKNIVIDPVMISSSGSRLMAEDALEAMKCKLLPITTLLTPNIPEAEELSEIKINTETDMLIAAEKISKNYGCAVLCKGGHSIGDANDLLYYNGEYCWFYHKRINNPNNHGTGCTLSSAIASNLAKGYDLRTSVERGKAYITGALSAMLDIGHGSGPMNHAFCVNNEFSK